MLYLFLDKRKIGMNKRAMGLWEKMLLIGTDLSSSSKIKICCNN